MAHENDFFRLFAEKGDNVPFLPDEGTEWKPDWDGAPEPLSGEFERDNAEALPEFAQEEREETPKEDPLPLEDARRKAPPIDALEEHREARKQPRFLGVRLRKAGQVFFFPDEEHTVRIGSKVVIELEHGQALGQVESIVFGLAPLAEGEEGGQVPGRVTGLATAQDIALHTENSILCAEATAFCKSCIRQRKLDMKLVDVEVLHDRSKIIFYFTAPARIDFRELVKDLVRNYRTRIELRQIGVRHESQMIGGIGNCGMVCCCHKYLRKFAPVTIKMAKEQNLFLNPAKLSGMCGRLLCCLSFEQGNYEEFNRRCPKLGKKYTSDNGTVKVLRANMFTQSVVVLSESGEESELSLEEWEKLHPRRADPPAPEQQRAAAQRSTAEAASRRGAPREHLRRAEPEDGADFLVEENEPDREGPAERPLRQEHNSERPHKPRKRRRTRE